MSLARNAGTRISLWATAAGFLWLADYVIGVNLLARGLDSFSLSGLAAWTGLFILATVTAEWKQLLLLACSLDPWSSAPWAPVPDATWIAGQVAVLASALISLLCLARAAYALVGIAMGPDLHDAPTSKGLVERLGDGVGWPGSPKAPVKHPPAPATHRTRDPPRPISPPATSRPRGSIT